MASRQPKNAWVTGKLATAERLTLERIADESFEGNLSAALRYCVRVAGGKRPPTRTAPGMT